MEWRIQVKQFNKKPRVGTPAAPRGTSLVLLPFGSDTIQRALPRRTHPKLDGMIPKPGKGVNQWIVLPLGRIWVHIKSVSIPARIIFQGVSESFFG